MKRILIIAFLSLSVGGFAQSYSLNTKGGTVSFNYVSESTKGTLKDVEAKVNISSSKLGAATVSGSVSVSTLSTGNKTRDQHLMSDEFFNAAKYPKMTFETGEVIKEGDYLKAKGKLTIKGVSKDVTFTVYEKEGALQFKATIYGADFGVATKKDRDSSKIQVIVKIPLS